MVKYRPYLALVLAVLLCIGVPLAAFADEEGDPSTGGIINVVDTETEDEVEEDEITEGEDPIEEEATVVDEDADVDEEECDEDEDDEDESVIHWSKAGFKARIKDLLQEWKERRTELRRAWKEAKTVLEDEKDRIEALKDEVEDELKSLQREYESARKSGDTAKMTALKVQLRLKQQELTDLKEDMSELREQMKLRIKAKYSAAELDRLEKAAARIKAKYTYISVLPVYHVIITGFEVKFDTPPVIKSGRTLLPVRAISEGFGAGVVWDEASQTVTITRGDDTIVLKLGNNQATLNGVGFTLDVPAETINSRTMVPLRFVIEKLRLRVEWDDATESIEIAPVEGETA